MLMRLNTKIGHIVKHACLMFLKIYRAVLKIFAKVLKFKNYHKIMQPTPKSKRPYFRPNTIFCAQYHIKAHTFEVYALITAREHCRPRALWPHIPL